MPKAIFLIGVPASGKSTYFAANFASADVVYISSDSMIEQYAASVGKTYDEVFKDYVNIATATIVERASLAIDHEMDVVWDQTNVSVKSRASKMQQFINAGYELEAVVFSVPDETEHQRRLDSRVGKSIPKHVIKSMIENFQMPTEAEGFTKITVIEN